MKDVPALKEYEMDAMDVDFRLRAQSVQAIDKMISDIRTLLQKKGLDTNTYIVFSADNGYHMGEYNFLPGKMTPFDIDIRVPLVVVGPGVPHQTVTEIAQNVDLAPTFTALAGLGASPPPTTPDGQSLATLLHGTKPPTWRKMALIEHHGPNDDPGDPDNEHHERTSGAARPPYYEALRTEQYLYVEYSHYDSKTGKTTVNERTYYDLAKDLYELNNIYDGLPATRKTELQATLGKNWTCGQSGMPTCWTVQQ